MESFAKVITFVLSCMCFLVGGLIYVTFRSETLVMFDWFHALGIDDLVSSLRDLGASFLPLPDWLLYSLPDGLWTLSYVLVMSALWDFDFHSHWKMFGLIPFIAISSEFLQLLGLIHGSFDWMDLFAYCFATIIGLIYCKIINILL